MWAPCKHRSYFALTRPRPAFQRPELIIASFGIGAAKGCSPSPKWRKSNAKRGNSVAISSRPLLQDDPETALRRAASLSQATRGSFGILPFLDGFRAGTRRLAVRHRPAASPSHGLQGRLSEALCFASLCRIPRRSVPTSQHPARCLGNWRDRDCGKSLLSPVCHEISTDGPYFKEEFLTSQPLRESRTPHDDPKS